MMPLPDTMKEGQGNKWIDVVDKQGKEMVVRRCVSLCVCLSDDRERSVFVIHG